MTSEKNRIPVFDEASASNDYQPRPAAYAVITDPKGRIAAVRGKSGYFLPGGGSLPDETPEQTLHRELLEELAREVRIARRLGEAIQYFHADGQSYRMVATFFAAEFNSDSNGPAEYELLWLERGALEIDFFHECHAWASRLV